MMNIYLKQYGILVTGLLLGFGSAAQTDTTMIMNPGDFEPDPTGFYLAGVTKQIDDCGPSELLFKGCDDAYGDSDHDESGTQFGWQYREAIIFHGCLADGVGQNQTCVGSANKYSDDHPEDWDRESGAFLRLGKHKNYDTDSANFGYLITPPFTSLKSLTIKTTTDISRQEGNREIVYVVEASDDGGQTWQYVDVAGDAWLEYIVTEQAGDVASFTEGGGSSGFDEIVGLSKEADSTMLRILPIPFVPRIDRHKDGQRLNIWEVVLEAQTVPAPADGGGGETVLASGLGGDFFTIDHGQLISTDRSELHVFNLSGKTLGKGVEVTLPCEGVFIIRNSKGATRKIVLVQ